MHVVEHIRGKQSLKRGPINEKYAFFPLILQIPGTINSPTLGVIRAIEWPKKLFLALFCLNAMFKIILPNEGGKLIFKKSDKQRGREGCVKHEMHKESNKLHTKLIKSQVVYIPSFCKRGLEAKTARESSYRLFLKGARSEHIANRTSNRATRAIKNDKIWSFFCRLGVKPVIFLIESIRSRFSKLCFPPGREAPF